MFFPIQGLQYSEIVSELRSSFPTFISDPALSIIPDDEPGNYLVFLISYVRENWDDLTVKERLADFMEKLFISNHPSVEITFSDFALDFYLHFKEHKVDITPFMNTLSPGTRDFIQYCADYWFRANEDAVNNSRKNK